MEIDVYIDFALQRKELSIIAKVTSFCYSPRLIRNVRA